MAKFPGTIPLPDRIKTLREERRIHMVSTAKRGVIFRLLIIFAELLGFVYFGSSALLLDGLSSIMDVGSSLFLIFCIKMADKPPDTHHPFGHGRLEPIGGLQLGIFLFVLGITMIVQQSAALAESTAVRVISPYTWLIPFGAVILLELGYQHIRRAAKKQNSPALLADAIHYRIDSMNSLFATIALLFAAYFPSYGVMIDHLGAIVIAVMMMVIGVLAVKNNLNQLLDRVPESSYFALVREAALQVEGVLSTEKLRIQIYGPDAHVAIDIEVDPLLSVEVAHEITQKVRSEIQKSWPSVRDVIVHVEPYYGEDHINRY